MKRALMIVVPVVLIAAGVAVGRMTSGAGDAPPEPVVVTTDLSSGEGVKSVAVENNRWDTDGDGKVSEEEYKAQRASGAFEDRDVNGDGFLTRDERERSAETSTTPITEYAQRAREALDASTVGHLNPASFPGPQDVFERLDLDKDGKITDTDLSRFKRHVKRDRGGGRARKGKKGKGGSRRGGR